MLNIINQKTRNAVDSLLIAMKKGSETEQRNAWIDFHHSIADTVKEEVYEDMGELKVVETEGTSSRYKSKSDFAKKVFDINIGNESIAQFAKGVMFNKWEDREPLQKTDGSVLAPVGIVADVIYEALNNSILLKHCPLMMMKEGTVIVGKINKNVSLDFKEKYATGIETDLGLEGIKLEAKTLYAYIHIAEEDLQDIKNLDRILTKAFAGAVAQALDENFLYTNPKSLDTSKKRTLNLNLNEKKSIYPKGILDYPGIKKVEATSTDYDMFLDASLEISKANGEPKVIGLNPVESHKLQKLKDSNGQYIMPPKMFNDLIKEQSNGLKEKDALVFDPDEVLIGVRNEMNIKMLPSLEDGTVVMRCMIRADVVPLREDHICKITIS